MPSVNQREESKKLLDERSINSHVATRPNSSTQPSKSAENSALRVGNMQSSVGSLGVPESAARLLPHTGGLSRANSDGQSVKSQDSINSGAGAGSRYFLFPRKSDASFHSVPAASVTGENIHSKFYDELSHPVIEKRSAKSWWILCNNDIEQMRCYVWRMLLLHETEVKEGEPKWVATSRSIIRWVVGVTVILNCLFIMLSTEPSLQQNDVVLKGLIVTDVAAFIVFFMEYFLRLWSCVCLERFRQPIFGRLKWATRMIAFLDLCLLTLFFIAVLSISDPTGTAGVAQSRLLRLVQLLRLLSLLHIERQSQAFHFMANVLSRKKHELLVSFFLAIVVLVISAAAILYAEAPTQPQQFDGMGAALWWAVNALTSVGYGDVTPVTTAGKCIAGVVSFLGVGLFAIPAGILGSGFVETMVEDVEVEPDIDLNVNEEQSVPRSSLGASDIAGRTSGDGIARSPQRTSISVVGAPDSQQLLKKSSSFIRMPQSVLLRMRSAKSLRNIQAPAQPVVAHSRPVQPVQMDGSHVQPGYISSSDPAMTMTVCCTQCGHQNAVKLSLGVSAATVQQSAETSVAHA